MRRKDVLIHIAGSSDPFRESIKLICIVRTEVPMSFIPTPQCVPSVLNGNATQRRKRKRDKDVGGYTTLAGPHNTHGSDSSST